jgi:hypothetical protein
MAVHKSPAFDIDARLCTTFLYGHHAKPHRHSVWEWCSGVELPNALCLAASAQNRNGQLLTPSVRIPATVHVDRGLDMGAGSW